MKDVHISRQNMEKLKNGNMTFDEKLEALVHLGECTLCAETFIDLYQDKDLLEIPPDFSAGVYREITRKNVSQKTRRNELYAYGFKVSIAACITFALMFSGTFGNSMNWVDKELSETQSWAEMTTIRENIKAISQRWIQGNVHEELKEDKIND